MGRQVPFKPLPAAAKGNRGTESLRELPEVPQQRRDSSGFGSLAMPTQHPVNAAKVSLVGFKSQKLKEIWHMVRSQGLFHFTDREAKPHRGQAPACKEPQCGPGSVQTSTKGSRLHPLSRNPSWWGSRQKSRPHTHTHTHTLSLHSPSHQTLGSAIPALPGPEGGLP